MTCVGCREAKKCKAYDMYQLLARMITFRESIGQLLAPVRKHLADASQPKVANKLSVLLQHASRGIHANATASPHDLMIFIHGVLEGGLAGEEAAREAAEAEATAAVHVPGEFVDKCFPCWSCSSCFVSLCGQLSVEGYGYADVQVVYWAVDAYM